jgi:hypothetical protein
VTGWRDKFKEGKYRECTENTPKRPNSVQQACTEKAPNTEHVQSNRNQHLFDFLRLVRITGACEHQVLLEDEAILAALDADDLTELSQLDLHDKQIWAQLLAHRLTRPKIWPTG